jgi:hypothetical protein
MGDSIARQALEHNVDKVISEGGVDYLNAMEYWRLLKKKHFDSKYVDTVYQLFWTRPVDLYIAYAFMSVHALMFSGQIACFRIQTDGCPCANDDIDGNNALLESALRGEFSGEFWGGLDDADGYVEWDKPVIGTVRTHDDNKDDPIISEQVIKPARVPLEIGYTAPETTLLHINQEGGVARYPYGQDEITVMVRRNPDTNKAPCFRSLDIGLERRMNEDFKVRRLVDL